MKLLVHVAMSRATPKCRKRIVNWQTRRCGKWYKKNTKSRQKKENRRRVKIEQVSKENQSKKIDLKPNRPIFP